jgi:hypothetical protein
LPFVVCSGHTSSLTAPNVDSVVDDKPVSMDEVNEIPVMLPVKLELQTDAGLLDHYGCSCTVGLSQCKTEVT